MNLTHFLLRSIKQYDKFVKLTSTLFFYDQKNNVINLWKWQQARFLLLHIHFPHQTKPSNQHANTIIYKQTVLVWSQSTMISWSVNREVFVHRWSTCILLYKCWPQRLSLFWAHYSSSGERYVLGVFKIHFLFFSYSVESCQKYYQLFSCVWL